MTLGLYYLMYDPMYFPEDMARRPKSSAMQKKFLMACTASGSYNWYEKSDLKSEDQAYYGRGIRIHELIKAANR